MIKGGQRDRGGEQAGHEGDKGPGRAALRPRAADGPDEEDRARAERDGPGLPAEQDARLESQRRQRPARSLQLPPQAATRHAAESQSAARHSPQVHQGNNAAAAL